MDVEIFSLCDAATVSGGKLNILGAFDSIRVASVPATLRSCAIAIRLRFNRTEAGTKAWQVRVLDSNGEQVLLQMNANVAVPIPAQEIPSATIQIVVEIRPLKLPRLGAYRIDLLLDGQVVKSLPLFAMQRS
jgi:hypothetical protein